MVKQRTISYVGVRGFEAFFFCYSRHFGTLSAQWDYDTNELNNCKNVMIIMKKMNLFRILLQVLQTQAMVGFNINTNKHIIKESFNLKKNNESYELKTKKDLDGGN